MTLRNGDKTRGGRDVREVVTETVKQFVPGARDAHSLEGDTARTGNHVEGAQQPRASVSSKWVTRVAAKWGSREWRQKWGS